MLGVWWLLGAASESDGRDPAPPNMRGMPCSSHAPLPTSAELAQHASGGKSCSVPAGGFAPASVDSAVCRPPRATSGRGDDDPRLLAGIVRERDSAAAPARTAPASTGPDRGGRDVRRAAVRVRHRGHQRRSRADAEGLRPHARHRGPGDRDPSHRGCVRRRDRRSDERPPGSAPDPDDRRGRVLHRDARRGLRPEHRGHAAGAVRPRARGRGGVGDCPGLPRRASPDRAPRHAERPQRAGDRDRSDARVHHQRDHLQHLGRPARRVAVHARGRSDTRRRPLRRHAAHAGITAVAHLEGPARRSARGPHAGPV